MKKLLALLLALAMACRWPPAAAPAPTPPAAAPRTAATAPARPYRVAMICDSSISDGGWGMSCYNAMVDAAEEHGWETELLRQHRPVRLL